MKLDTTAVAVEVEMFKHRNKKAVKVANTLEVVAVLTALLAVGPAHAADLKETATNIFTLLYGVVGVGGAIGLVVTGMNWAFGNFMGSGDPKKLFFQVLIGTIGALASVSIILAVKTWLGAADAITAL